MPNIETSTSDVVTSGGREGGRERKGGREGGREKEGGKGREEGRGEGRERESKPLSCYSVGMCVCVLF